jgi:putative sporulation protein YtxC
LKRDEWTIDPGVDASLSRRLTAMLNKPFAGLADSKGQGPWTVTEPDGRIHCSLTIAKGREDFCGKTGAVLAEYMVTDREPAFLRQWLRSRFGLRGDGSETDVAVAEAILLLNGEPDAAGSGRGRQRRIRKWGPTFAAYLKENSFVHLEGFIRFRLRDYDAELKEAAETAMEERLMERQYEEFVTLLQSMVAWQEVRVPAVHVMHAGGHAFRLLDEKMRPLERDGEEVPFLLEEEPEDGIIADEQEEESLLVSRLLAASPRHLYIHTAEPDAQVIRTLMGIFGERAALCPEMNAPT